MVKASKSGRSMNPTDAARKQARKKEIARNKLERDLQRATPKDVSEISKRLEELIEEEENEKVKGKPLSKQLHIRRKVLQDAMKLAVAKEREANLKEKFGDEGVRTTPHGHGVPQRRPEDSVYYHPVNNPTGMPPPGRPQRYKDDVDLMDPAKADEVEAALRARMRAQPEAAARSSDGGEGTILPPPGHPPPGILPPPDGPPPGMSMLPAGVLPPPSDAPPGVILPPPTAPPPGMLGAPLAPPPVPPPGLPHGALPPPVGLPPGVLPPAANMADMSAAPQVTAAKPVETVMEGAATALRTIPAQQDSKLTSMVPAALRAKRHKEQAVKKSVHVEARGKDRGFGLAPLSVAGKAAEVQDSALDAFMSEIANL